MTESRIIASHDYGPKRFKWLTLKLIEWQDPNGKARFWESCERTTRASTGVDAVAIVVKAISTFSPPKIVLVSQYRPPLASTCLELPAGLIDQGETAENAAFRELFEETGLTPRRLLSLTPECCSDPGLTNTNMQLAVVEVDLDAPVNRNAEQKLDDGESIEIEWAPWNGLLPWLLQRKMELGCQIDARLMSFAVGLDLSSRNDLIQGSGGSSPSLQKIASSSSTANRWSSAQPPAACIIGALTEKNVASNNSAPNTTNNNTNSTSTPRSAQNQRPGHQHGNNNNNQGRSDSVQTDVLHAMSHLQIQAAAKAYAETLQDFHAGRHHTSSASSTTTTSTSTAGVMQSQAAAAVSAAATEKTTSATRTNSSVLSDGEGDI